MTEDTNQVIERGYFYEKKIKIISSNTVFSGLTFKDEGLEGEKVLFYRYKFISRAKGMSRDKKIVPLKVAILAAFFRTSFIPSLTCSDCCNGQEHVPISD